jgi:hypothetical protein
MAPTLHSGYNSTQKNMAIISRFTRLGEISKIIRMSRVGRDSRLSGFSGFRERRDTGGGWKREVGSNI